MSDETSTNYSRQGEEKNNKIIHVMKKRFYILILLKGIGKKNLTKYQIC